MGLYKQSTANWERDCTMKWAMCNIGASLTFKKMGAAMDHCFYGGNISDFFNLREFNCCDKHPHAISQALNTIIIIAH